MLLAVRVVGGWSLLYAHEQVWKITLHDSDIPLPTMLPYRPSLSQQKEQLSRRDFSPFHERTEAKFRTFHL